MIPYREAATKAAVASVKATMSGLRAMKEGKDYTVKGFKWVLKTVR